MKIIRVITRLNAGGPTWQAEFLSKALSETGHETLLVHGTLAPGEASAPAHWLIAPRSVWIPALARAPHPVKDAIAFLALFRLFRRERPDVVHTHHAKAGALGRLAAWMAGVPVIVHTFHGNVLTGYFSPGLSRGVAALERFLARLSTALVTVSSSQKRDLTGRFRVAPSEKFHLVPLGIDLAPFLEACFDPELKKRLGVPEKAPVVGIVARLEPIKDVGRFLEIARRVSIAREDAWFLIVGDGPLRADLARRAHALGIAGKTIFLGTREDVARLYPLMDVVCLTSQNEGTPLVLIEAMAAGRAVASHAVGGVSDLVEDGQTGVLVPPDDPYRFAEAVIRLLMDPASRKFLGAAAQAASRRYGVQPLVEGVERIYEKNL